MVAMLSAGIAAEDAENVVAAAPRVPAVRFDSTPVWAARSALEDLKSLPDDLRPVTRYVWLRGGTEAELAELSYVVNSTLSKVNLSLVPGDDGAMTVLHGGRLVRLNLSRIATSPEDQANLVATWEKLAGVNVDFTVTIRELKLFDVPKGFVHTDGKRYTSKWDWVTAQSPAAIVATEMAEMGGLTAVTVGDGPLFSGTIAPIVEGRVFLRAALSTLEGGLYYQFRGIRSGMKLNEYLVWRGINPDEVKRLESEERAVVFISRVTAKERTVVLFQGSGVRPSMGNGIGSITFDPFDDRRSNDSPSRNLLGYDGDGSEVIVEIPNGFHEWTLWDAKGNLVLVAPQNLVTDSEVPKPHTANLQPGISCIRCHAQDDGWRGLGEDIEDILTSGYNVYGDLGSRDDVVKQQQLIAGQYDIDWFTAGTGPFSLGRLTYNRAVFRATGKPIGEVSKLVADRYAAYQYAELDAWGVASELGVVGMPPSDSDPTTKDDLRAACGVLKQFIGATSPAEREDVIIAAVLSGKTVSRRSWETAVHIASDRAYQRSLK